MSLAGRDRLLGVITAVFGSTYVAASRAIEDSLLADSVGAGGVPQAVGFGMAVAGLVLFAWSWRHTPKAPVVSEGGEQTRERAALRTAALAGLLIAYALLLPWIGYVPAIFLLLLASGLRAGAPLGPTLGITAAAGALFLWLLFDRLLQVRLPVGTLWG